MTNPPNIHKSTGPSAKERELSKLPLVAGNERLFLLLNIARRQGSLLRRGFHSRFDTHVQGDQSDWTPFDKKAEVNARREIRKFDPQAQIMGEELTPDMNIPKVPFWVVDPIDGTTNFSQGIPFCNFTTAYIKDGLVQAGVVFNFLTGEYYYAVLDSGSFKAKGTKYKSLKVDKERPFNKSVISFAPLRYYGRDKWPFEEQAVNALWHGMEEITKTSGRFHREMQSGGLELSYVAEGRFHGFASSWTSPWDLSAGVLLVREAGGIVTNIFGETWQPSFAGVIAGTPKVHPEMLAILQKHFKTE